MIGMVLFYSLSKSFLADKLQFPIYAESDALTHHRHLYDFTRIGDFFAIALNTPQTGRARQIFVEFQFNACDAFALPIHVADNVRGHPIVWISAHARLADLEPVEMHAFQAGRLFIGQMVVYHQIAAARARFAGFLKKPLQLRRVLMQDAG